MILTAVDLGRVPSLYDMPDSRRLPLAEGERGISRPICVVKLVRSWLNLTCVTSVFERKLWRELSLDLIR